MKKIENRVFHFAIGDRVLDNFKEITPFDLRFYVRGKVRIPIDQQTYFQITQLRYFQITQLRENM